MVWPHVLPMERRNEFFAPECCLLFNEVAEMDIATKDNGNHTLTVGGDSLRRAYILSPLQVQILMLVALDSRDWFSAKVRRRAFAALLRWKRPVAPSRRVVLAKSVRRLVRAGLLHVRRGNVGISADGWNIGRWFLQRHARYYPWFFTQRLSFSEGKR